MTVDPGSLVATIDGVDYPIAVRQGRTQVRKAMLVIDTSGSMGRDGMQVVRAATAAYLRTAPEDVLVGVVSFANTAGVDLAPTTNRKKVQSVVNGLVSDGDTTLYAGMRSAVNGLGRSGDRSIVLLSDGADTVSRNATQDLTQVTSRLRSAGIRVDVVRFRSEDPDATPALQGFARANGGTVVSADNTQEVTRAFEASAKALDTQATFVITGTAGLLGAKTLEVRGRAGGSAFTASQEVTLTSAPPADEADTPPPAAGAVVPVPGTQPVTSWYPLLAAGLIAFGLFGLVGASLVPSLQTAKERRLDSIDQFVVGPNVISRSENKSHSAPLSEQLTAFGDRVMTEGRGRSWVIANIERADLPLRAGDWFVLHATSSIGGAAVGFVLGRAAPVVFAALGFALGALLPPLVLRFLAQRRAVRFERILPDVLMLVATSLKSGFGLPQSLDAVARDAAEPAAKEFSRALAETRIGTDVADALEHAANRMDSKALRWTIMAIRIQREVGGNLAETLQTTANTLRERESLFRQVRALSAEGRLSAYILIALPIGMLLYMMAVNYDYISLLWTTGLGIVMIVFGIIILLVGIVWMRRVVKIEV
ncbi:type II secretion system F family protein [Intrasporangium calvum]|uniref:Type II secretion system F family protein n=1 Tax=Intrasporangium calvum TaxID=53358 RepID=A0ABT5GIQ1_9MICO|nr:type II secretion system F family protein [Intrasporangium calvum]MDC5698128.1 type II secretion system F family protein [Intrasporangium calvum]